MRQRLDADGRLTFYGYYGYDASRRPTTEMHDIDAWLYFTYDSLGNLTTIQDDTGTFTSDYDALNRRVTKRTQAGNVYFQYDPSSMRVMSVGPDGGGTYHAYDAASRLTTAKAFDLVIPGQRSTLYTYDASGMRLSKISGAGTVMAYYLYDNAAQLAQIANRGHVFSAIVSYFAYGRDANGNVTSITRESTCAAGNNAYFTFDPLDRPTLEEHRTGAVLFYGWLYNYDAASNRLLRYDEVAANATYYAFDARNLMTKETQQ
jgi:YD repeat-containing protein